MLNFSFISNKNFFSFIKKVNYFLINIFNYLQFNNLKRLTKLFLIDKRVIITLIIIFFSVFVHLSTPAFYKDSWVKGIVKNQFEKKFNFKIEFSDELSYAIFPVPHFNFKNAKFVSDNRNLAQIETIKVYLTFSKFLDKNKMNIQNIVIKKAKFELYKKDIKNLLDFFNKKINEKKISIIDSQIFLKNKQDDIFSIISINKSKSFYDNLELINKLNVSGEIFNNSFKLNLKNNFDEKKSNLILILNKLNKKFVNIINFSEEIKVGNLSYFDSRNKHDTNYNFDKGILKFNSSEKIDDKFLYDGFIKFSPFTSNLNVNLKNINLKKLIGGDSFFVEVLKSNIFANDNLNFVVNIKSKNVLDHRKLKDLNLKISYENQSLNFNQSNLLFEDILLIRLTKSEFKNLTKKQYFIGEFELLINDYLNFHKFLQTKKEFRKKIDTIKLLVRYDFLKNKLIFENVKINEKNNEQIKNFIEQFNQQNRNIRNRIDLRNFLTAIIEEL
tara:strand:- start:6488 stop:7984 length:1497 start_codon:yes stop_codon:yes gene_type:complete